MALKSFSLEPQQASWKATENGFFLSMRFAEVNVSLGAPGYINTRLLGGALPAPTIRMQRCENYTIQIVNTVQYESNAEATSLTNGFKEPYLTNLHLHGLYMDPYQDNVFRSVQPGEAHNYTIHVPCEHSGGTMWYHSHHHGSAALQVGGGAAGMLIVDDAAHDFADANAHEYYANLMQYQLILHLVLPEFLQSIAQKAGDSIWESSQTEPFYIANGQVALEIEMQARTLQHWRILHISPTQDAVIQAVGCMFFVLSKDGIPLQDAPRSIGDSLYLTPGGRVDCAVQCYYDTSLYAFLDQGEEEDVAVRAATIRVSMPMTVSEMSAHSTTLPTLKPTRPKYLADLHIDFARSPSLFNTFTVKLSRDAINDVSFEHQFTSLHTIALGKKQAWTIDGTDQHPLHMHVRPMQLAASHSHVSISNWFKAGDWHDIVTGNASTVVLFEPVRYPGPMVIHCHSLDHEDLGSMAIINVIYGRSIAKQTRF